uniref:Membrane-associated protein Hem n=1 Tax=Ditylenchus dipsaci TaxID=166011 RepID=A0A915DJ47_9BILA
MAMLTRIYNTKKACGTLRRKLMTHSLASGGSWHAHKDLQHEKGLWDSKSRPQFLNDKSLDAAIAHIVKKFPVIDLKRNSSAFMNVNEIRSEVIKNLSLYYYTFADLLDLKDHILQLLTTMDANQCQLDITLNYDLTAGYLNLVINFISIMILLSRVEDRKTVLGLFSTAYEFVHNTNEPSFPRLGQMIIDYENPIKKLSEDLGPLNRLIHSSLTSLKDIYLRRNISAEQQREASMISLISSPKQMLYAAQTTTIACEYLSLDVMDRWIIFGVTICHNALLSDGVLQNMYHRALQHGLALRLFRDESILVFPMIQNLFESIKGYHKRVHDMKELASISLQTCGSLHAHRRQFLRTALRELCFLIKDQPGLLGPKILFVWMGLSFARDEVLWILRHADIWPTVNVHKKTKISLNNIVVDKYLPELLFYMTELRMMVLKHSNIISRYYMEYVAGYDTVALGEMLDGLNSLSDNDEVLIRSFVDSVCNIKTDNPTNLCGVRLDWFRFQANVSVARSTFRLQDHEKFAVMMNTTIFHLKMIDVIGEMLRETSDLNIYCFYPQLFDAHVKQCLNFPAQSRYVVSFALLEELAKRTAEVLVQMSQEELQLAESVQPKACARIIAVAYQQSSNNSSSKNHPQQTVNDVKMPGHESMRTSKDGVSNVEKNHMYLVELCQAIAHYKEITISDHIFVPRDTCQLPQIQQLLGRWSNDNPRRPSEMLTFLTAQMAVLQSLDTCLTFDITRLFNDALLQQTQGQDSHGNDTITSTYSRWYLEVLLRKASIGQLLYSDHLQSFVSNSSTDHSGTLLAAEQYTDCRELRALAQLIGPYGVKFIGERLIWHVACQITELYKIIRDNREALHAARVNFDKPERLREVLAVLSLVDNGSNGKDRRGSSGSAAQQTASGAPAGSPIESVLQRITIIGEIIAFRDLLFKALHDVLEQRIPFLVASLHSLLDTSDELQKISIGEMCAAVGVKLDVDLALVNAIQAKVQADKVNNDPEEHYNTSCLLLVFIAIALPKLAIAKQSAFKASLLATQNNCSTIPLAVNSIAGAVFFLHRRGDIQERMREFLALASSGLLQIVGTPEAEQMQQHQSVYILLDQLVKDSPWLNYGLLESCFPYTLIRSSYLNCYRHEQPNQQHNGTSNSKMSTSSSLN